MRDGVSLSTQNEGTGSSLLDVVVLRLEAARACSMLESNLLRHKTREAPVTSSSSASSFAECVSLLAERKAALAARALPVSAQVRAARDQPAPARKVISILVMLTLRDTLSNLFMYIQILTMKEHYVNSISNSLYCISRLNLGFSLLFSF